MQELKIKAWFNQKTIFVTGGTGFLGKVLIEKLLHDCLSLNKIYVLIRADDQFELFERFIKFKSNKIFDRIREIDENLLNKLTPIKGDLSKLNLNLSDRDKSILINECNIIIHGGASVKFDIKLNDIILLNVRGTRELCLLSKNCKNLKSFIYISTAFSNCNEKKKIYEKIYPTIFEPNFVIDLCERNCEEHLLKDILKIYPNTYIFSKNLAEKLLYDMHEDLPCGIVRPSIITPSVKDPYSGWVDSRNGPMGYILGAGSGLIRSAHGCYHAVADLLPVDFAANATIAVACNVGQFKISKCPIYNLSTSSDAPLTWRSVLDLGKEISVKNL